MTRSETDIARVRRWVAEQNEQIGEHIDEMRVEMDVDARVITILECRPPWREDFGPEWTRQEIARLRYTKSTGVWTLYWPDRNTKFHRYEDLDPTPSIDRLLSEIDADPICIFWAEESAIWSWTRPDELPRRTAGRARPPSLQRTGRCRPVRIRPWS